MRLRSTYFSVLLITAAVVFMRQPVQSQMVYEDFKPNAFPAVSNGGTGFSGPWQSGSSGTIGENSLDYAGLQTSGGSVSVPLEGAFFSRALAQAIGANNTAVYISFLLQPQGTLGEGSFFGLVLNNLFIGKPGHGMTEEYVLESFGGEGQVSSDASVVIGDTALLVVKAEFRPGNDIFTLYANPIPGDPEPASGAVKADLKVGTVSSISIGGVGTALGIDEIRIGSTYASVVPAVPAGSISRAKPAASSRY